MFHGKIRVIQAVFFRNLTDFLRPAIRLTVLFLDVSNTPGFTSVDPFSQIELPSVHSFSISNWNANPRLDDARGVRSLSSGDFIGVIKAIRLPNLRLLFIAHTFFEYSLSLEQWLLDAFPLPTYQTHWST